MVAFNPNFPEVLGQEWLATHDQKARVWSGAHARMMRIPSTVTETIDGLRLSAAVNTQSRASVPTFIDVIEEGSEAIPLLKLTALKPNSDVAINNWRTQAGGATNLFQSIDEAANRWGSASSPARNTWIENKNGFEDYECTVDATDFGVGGALENARIGWVGIEAILGTNTGFRKLRTTLTIGGSSFEPAGSNLRNVHGFGSIFGFWYGEINPATQLPWTPADIADFGTGGASTIKFRSQESTSSRYPLIYAVALNVQYLTVENRVAVGVWRRPEDIGDDRLVNIETDDLVSLPSGTPGWSKTTGINYLYYWRMSVSPSEYGPVVADDVRWNGLYQQLGPAGKPPGISYPLHSSGVAPPPSNVLASQSTAHDPYGRPEDAFAGDSRAAYAIAPIRSDLATSVDTQPYRLDLGDLVILQSTSGITGQRVTPATTQTYVGFRLPVVPVFADATLTVSVHVAATGAQVGGDFTIHSTAVGKIPGTNVRYVTGFFSSPAALTGGTQYEIRITSTLLGIGKDTWTLYAPDCSLAPERSFNGTIDHARIDGVLTTDRDLCVNLIRQPDPPENLAATIIDVPVTTSAAAQTTSVEHVRVTWDPPGAGVGAVFDHYELERQLDSDDWQRVANVNDSVIGTFDDHEVPRETVTGYRVRAVHSDGRISAWVTSNTVTPMAPGQILIFTSNHDRAAEVAYLYGKEGTWVLLSSEGDETVRIYGSDNQVVFMESENRGIGWRTMIAINQLALQGKGGEHVLTALIDLIRSQDVPYIAVLDSQGTQILGHVSVGEATHRQPQHRYTADIDVTPTHSEPVPVEVS